jgi:hypothetical protein
MSGIEYPYINFQILIIWSSTHYMINILKDLNVSRFLNVHFEYLIP